MKHMPCIGELTIRFDMSTENPVLADYSGLIYNKSSFLKMVEDFLDFFDCYSDEEIEEMNRKTLHRLNNPEHYIRKTPPKKGHVYFVKAENGLTKIGESQDLKTRYKALMNNIPLRIDFLFAIESDDVRKLERELHKQFDKQKSEGEWFELSDKDLSNLKLNLEKQGYEIVCTIE